MNALCPAVPKFLLKGASRELQPSRAEVGAQLVHTRHPDQYRCRIGDETEACFALAKRRLRTLVCRHVQESTNSSTWIAVLVQKGRRIPKHVTLSSVIQSNGEGCVGDRAPGGG